MEIQKYKATIKGTQDIVVGYICEVRKRIEKGGYSEETDYLISVNCKSMPDNGEKWGSFLVDPESIEMVGDSSCKCDNLYPINAKDDSRCVDFGKNISYLDK